MFSSYLVKFDELSEYRSVREEKYFVTRVLKRQRFIIQILLLKFCFC